MSGEQPKWKSLSRMGMFLWHIYIHIYIVDARVTSQVNPREFVKNERD